MELSIDASTNYAGVAISREGNTVVELVWRSERNHSVELLPAIQRLMGQMGISTSDFDSVIVARGPGSFSALRVGMSTARGLAMVANIPLVGVGTLDIEAFPYLGLGLPIYAMVEAGRSQMAVAVYDAGYRLGGECPEPALVTVEDMIQSLDGPAIFCGEGVVSIAKEVGEESLEEVKLASIANPTRRPSALAYLGYRRFKRGDVGDMASLEPIYLRGPSITKSKRWKF